MELTAVIAIGAIGFTFLFCIFMIFLVPEFFLAIRMACLDICDRLFPSRWDSRADDDEMERSGEWTRPPTNGSLSAYDGPAFITSRPNSACPSACPSPCPSALRSACPSAVPSACPTPEKGVAAPAVSVEARPQPSAPLPVEARTQPSAPLPVEARPQPSAPQPVENRLQPNAPVPEMTIIVQAPDGSVIVPKESPPSYYSLYPDKK